MGLPRLAWRRQHWPERATQNGGEQAAREPAPPTAAAARVPEVLKDGISKIDQLLKYRSPHLLTTNC